jgi:MYXO-CTERM domain-containing protein
MKRNLTKAVGAGVLTLSMGFMPLTLPVQAQTTTDPGANTTPRTTTYDRSDRNDFDWGWLGLLGLLGLAGLSGRKRDDEPTRYRDPNTPGATTYRD